MSYGRPGFFDHLLQCIAVKWDFSIYPEMTEVQRHAVFSIGLTMLSIQGVERSTGFLIQWVFPTDPTLDLRALYAMDAKKQKRTPD